MMSLDSFLLFVSFFCTASPGCCLRLLGLKVPSVVDVRDSAKLMCTFDLEGDTFFSLKWYKEELEFFRYMPDYVPRIQTFEVDGVNIQENECNVSAITLSPLEYSASGTYRCEVSAGAPHFKVVYKHANMTVLGLPKENPKVYGIQESYVIGSYVAANCTSSPSHPPAKMDWYINGAKAQQWFTDHYSIDQPEDGMDLETRTIGLKFQTDHAHFQQRKDGSLSLVCSATVADRTRSTEIKAYLSKLTKEKFAQRMSNCCRSVLQTLLLLTVVVVCSVF